MDAEILDLTVERIELPLKNTFKIAVRSADSSPIARWTLTTSAGVFLGESVPVKYVTGETIESVLACLDKLSSTLIGNPIHNWNNLIALLKLQFPKDVSARTGVEIAIYNALSAIEDKPMYKFFGGKSTSVETDLTLTKIPEACDIAIKAWADGFRCFKMKVGGEDIEGDYARVLEIQNALPQAKLRLDGNQGFQPNEAIQFCNKLLSAGVNLELIEQPVLATDSVGLSEVAKEVSTPVIADEACHTALQAEKLFDTTAVSGVNVKLMKSGIQEAVKIVELAQSRDKKLMIGCMLESPIGIFASLSLACGTAAFDYIDLDGHLLLKLSEPIKEFDAVGPRLSLKYV